MTRRRCRLNWYSINMEYTYKTEMTFSFFNFFALPDDVKTVHRLGESGSSSVVQHDTKRRPLLCLLTPITTPYSKSTTLPLPPGRIDYCLLRLLNGEFAGIQAFRAPRRPVSCTREKNETANCCHAHLGPPGCLGESFGSSTSQENIRDHNNRDHQAPSTWIGGKESDKIRDTHRYHHHGPENKGRTRHHCNHGTDQS